MDLELMFRNDQGEVLSLVLKPVWEDGAVLLYKLEASLRTSDLSGKVEGEASPGAVLEFCSSLATHYRDLKGVAKIRTYFGILEVNCSFHGSGQALVDVKMAWPAKQASLTYVLPSDQSYFAEIDAACARFSRAS